MTSHRPPGVPGFPRVPAARPVVISAAVLLAAAAAWLSQGTIAFSAVGGPRVAVLPYSISALVVVAATALAVALVSRASGSVAPLSLLALLVLPWLPLPLPAAVLAWSGPIRWLIWFAIAVLLFTPLVASTQQELRKRGPGRWVREHPRLAAGLLAFAIFSASAWRVAPSIPGGDEPHYLVITQSLLFDRDLKIENNHRRGDYQAYFPGPLAPHYVQRGRDGEIYSIHAPGLSAIVAPAFAIAGYRGVVWFLMALAACGSALAWHLGWLATARASSAWFGWAATTLSATAIFHSFTVYPDGLGGVVVLTGVWALCRAHQERSNQATRLAPWFLHGAALALLPWMHSRFAVLACSLGALILLRLAAVKRPAEKAVAFLSIPSVSAIAWIAFFVVIYGRADPSAPYGTSTRDFSLAFIPGGLTGLLFDQRFGLLANAPVLICGVAGLVLMCRRQGAPANDDAPVANWRLALELIFVLVPYLLTAASYAMWWAGWSAPARFANPAVFALAIPAAVFWQRAMNGGHRATVAIGAGSLAFTTFLSVVLVTVDGGRLAYNTREATALWLEWASPIAALGTALPAWYRGEEAVFARDVTIWIALLAAGYLLIRSMERWPALGDRARYATASALIFAVVAMVASTIVWRLHGIGGVVAAPAQLAVLRRVATESQLVALQIQPPRALDRSSLLSGISIESEIAGLAGSSGRGRIGRGDQPLTTLPWLPAGRYRIRPRTSGKGGSLMIGIAADQFSIWSGPAASDDPIAIDLPVDVRALIVRGDEEARRLTAAIGFEAIDLVSRDARLTDRIARRGVNYDVARVFFLDEGCFPEPDAYWIGGSRQCAFVVQPEHPRGSIPVQIRNAPVANTLTLSSGQWRASLTLGAGEERRLEIPLVPGQRAVLVTASSATGFRPSEGDAKSRDARFLGVWMKIVE